MTGISIKVTGADDLSGRLRKLSAGLGDMRAGFTALARAARAVVRGAAPRRSGRLAQSVDVTVAKNYASVNAAVPYATAANYGWPRRNAATHFLQAGDQAWGGASGVLDKEVTNIIRKSGL